MITYKTKQEQIGNGFGATISNGTTKSNTILGRYYKDGREQLIIQRGRGKNSGNIHTEKSPTLSSCAWEQNNLVALGNIYNNGHNSQAGLVYSIDGKIATINAGGCGTGLYLENYRIRRLTPEECALLQTIPLWYLWACSDTQIYRMLGNGWTVEVIKHILSFFPNIEHYQNSA